MNLILTINGVLNTNSLLNRNVTVDSNKVMLVQSIVDETNARVFLYCNGKSCNVYRNPFFKLLGLKYGIVGIVDDKSIKQLIKSKYVLISSDLSLLHQKNVVITNSDYGLQESDVRKAINILKGY